jgi:hypothetical protein
MKFIVSFALMLISASLLGQTFSEDRARFVRDFERIMRQSGAEDIRSFVKDEFGPFIIESGQFPDDRFLQMVRTSNAMVEKRVKIFPEVFNYIISFYTLVKDQQSKESFDAWHNTVEQMMNSRNTRRFNDLLTISAAFFQNRIIALDPNFEWYYEGGNYEFFYNDGPFINFSEGRLVCRTINRGRGSIETPFTDSMVIYNTRGVYNFMRERWEGEGGRVTWEKVGLAPDQVFADLTKYSISMKSTTYNCDTVSITYPYFSEPIKGRFIDRAQRGSANQNQELPFPNFQSFERKYKINNIVKDVDYTGGFSVQGPEFVGEGNAQEPAQLLIKRNNKPFVLTRSAQVRVSERRLNAPDCAITMLLDKDSITHPSVNLTLNLEENNLLLQRIGTGLSQSPFVNSYHQLDMYVEQLEWNRSSDKISLGFNFATSQQQRLARFESVNYYDEKLYQRLQGMESKHPLAALWDYAFKYDEYILPEGKAATALGRTIQQAKSTLLDLSALGFITYDTERGMVSITQKLENFVKAKAGRSDYDNIQFTSDLTPQRMDGLSQQDIDRNPELKRQQEQIQQRNRNRERMKEFGFIDLKNYHLDIGAVDLVPISQFKNTQIFPNESKIEVRKNRDIYFNGWINSGKWEVNIANGYFDYGQNAFNIFESDVALFRAEPMKPEHGSNQIPIQSPISGVKGMLFVDDVTNRSGLNPEHNDFPKLSCVEKTRVYYDQKDLHRGAYTKDRFYFELDPFDMDSLNSFNEKYVRLAGELVSAGIFPKFREELKIMNDYSLGFARDAPDGGFPFYGTEARYDNRIVLSNNGLQGSGQIDFLLSSSISNAFTFLPDSTIGYAQFTNLPQEDGIQFPDVKGEDAFITFLPYSETLKARSNKKLLAFFEGEAKLKGELILKKEGMRGNGIMEMSGANMLSKNYRYKRWQTDADTAIFNLVNKYKDPANLDEDPLAFKTDNVTAHVDFKERFGEFTSNAGTSVVEFPVNKYICKIDKFTWLMDSDDVEMSKAENPEQDDISIEAAINTIEPNFYSIHPKQDSLQFLAPKARFNLKEKAIYCKDITFIEVADARIAPDSGKVTIRRNAKMETLNNSLIVANYITQYHRIEKATTNIFARRSYESKGEYPYFDSDSNRYTIFFPAISLDTSFQTVAQGKISISDSFRLGPQFDFYGDVALKAAEPHLTFKGATRINHDCERFERNWLAFEAPIDPTNILIPVAQNMKDLNESPISAGIVWRHHEYMDSVKLYPTFLSALQHPDDPSMITASGFLRYDKKYQEFQIATKEKFEDRRLAGNYIALHTKSCSMNGEGRIDLGMDFGTLVVDAVGVINYNQENDRTDMNLTMMIQAPVDEKIFENIAKNMSKNQALEVFDMNATTLEQAVVEWSGRDAADRVIADFVLEKRLKRVPKEMQHMMVLTGVKMTSYKEFGDEQVGLKTTTDQAVLVNIFGEQVMRKVPVKIFAEQRTAFGDRLGIMMNVPAGNFYFFDYDNRKSGILNILTNDTELRLSIDNLKLDKRKDKRFQYQTTNSTSYQAQFLRIFNQEE